MHKRFNFFFVFSVSFFLFLSFLCLPRVSRAKSILVKAFEWPARAEVWGQRAHMYRGANSSTVHLGELTGDIVFPVFGRSSNKIDAWGNTAYWFEIKVGFNTGWVLGNQINFLRHYQNQDPYINKFIKSRARTQPGEIYFYKIDLNADEKQELVLQWNEPKSKKKNNWHVAVCVQKPTGLAAGAIYYKAIYSSKWDQPVSIWFEDVDMDKRNDVVIAYSARRKYALQIVKWIHEENSIRKAFSAEVFRKNPGADINLITKNDGRVDVEVISHVKTNPPAVARKYYKPYPGGSYRRVL